VFISVEANEVRQRRDKRGQSNSRLRLPRIACAGASRFYVLTDLTEFCILPRNLAPGFGQYTYEGNTITPMNQKRKTTKRPTSKTTVEVRDLKPSKDAKGGGGLDAGTKDPMKLR
jgi:hypothetical protein